MWARLDHVFGRGSVSLAACVRSCATAGLAADAVSTFAPLGAATNAPYTSRSSIASRASASPA